MPLFYYPAHLLLNKGCRLLGQDPSSREESFAVEAWNWKYRARKELDVRGYDKVMYVGQRIDSMTPLQAGKFHAQGAWNRLIRDVRSGHCALGGELPAPLRGLKVKPFEAGEIMFPIEHETNYATYKDACMVHALGLGCAVSGLSACADAAEVWRGLAAPKPRNIRSSGDVRW